jgi:hypothetical protein
LEEAGVGGEEKERQGGITKMAMRLFLGRLLLCRRRL